MTSFWDVKAYICKKTIHFLRRNHFLQYCSKREKRLEKGGKADQFKSRFGLKTRTRSFLEN